LCRVLARHFPQPSFQLKGYTMKNLLATVAILGLTMGAANATVPAGPPGNVNNNNCNGAGSCAGGTPSQPTNITNNTRARATAHASSRATATGVGVGVGGAARSAAAGGNASVIVQNGSGGPSYVEARDRLRVPDANAPAIWSNNPCVVALSGGVAVAGFGMSIGAGIEDRDCTRRANAQHLIAMGEAAAAREVLCQNAEVRAAFVRAGRPCAADIAQPVVQSVLSVAAPTAAVPAANRPAYCGNLLARGLVTDECR